MLAAVAPARPAAAATAAPRAAARASSGRRGCRRAACMAVAGEDKLISKAPIPEKVGGALAGGPIGDRVGQRRGWWRCLRAPAGRARRRQALPELHS